MAAERQGACCVVPKDRSCGRGSIKKYLKSHFGNKAISVMAYNDDRQMYDVDLTCDRCGGHISQLPFQPSGDRKVYCNDCNRAYWQDKRSRGGYRDRGPRQMFQVDVNCSECGKHIDQLPFEPKGDKAILCVDCLKAKRAVA